MLQGIRKQPSGTNTHGSGWDLRPKPTHAHQRSPRASPHGARDAEDSAKARGQAKHQERPRKRRPTHKRRDGGAVRTACRRPEEASSGENASTVSQKRSQNMGNRDVSAKKQESHKNHTDFITGKYSN